MLSKPPACNGCPYQNIGGGFVPPDRWETGLQLLGFGEAPGAEEEASGAGFQGPSGRLLRGTVTRAGLNAWRSNFAVSNAMLCRPPGNKFPGSSIAAECLRRHQLPQLTAPNRPPIVAYGANAVHALTGRYVNISKVRGTWLPIKAEFGGGWLIATIHPSFAMRGVRMEEPGETDNDSKGMVEYKVFLGIDTMRALQGGPRVPNVYYLPTAATVRTLFRQANPALVSIDVESQKGNIAICGFAWDEDNAYVLNWSDETRSLVREVYETSTPCFHNATYDVPELELAGCGIPSTWVDTINTAALVNPGVLKGLQPQVLTHVSGSIMWKGLVDHDKGYDVVTAEVNAMRSLWTDVLHLLGRQIPRTGRDWYAFYNGLDVSGGLRLALAHKLCLQSRTLSSTVSTMEDLR